MSSSPNKTFDFALYVISTLSLTPSDVDIQPLSGGFTNLTARVTFKRSIHFPSDRTPPLSSAILKYAAPFMAAFPDAPVSMNRQAVEAKALELLANNSHSDPLPELTALIHQLPSLKLPRLIHHDESRNVLWITDLGPLELLTDYLVKEPPPPSEAIERVARTLGAFLSGMFSLTQNPPKELLDGLSDSKHLIHGLLTSFMEKHLLAREVPDTPALVVRVTTAVDRVPEEPCLGLVDFWPGCVLVDEKGECGLVDWEYFGVTSPGLDLGGLIGHLHVTLLRDNLSQEAIQSTRTFLSTFYATYSQRYPQATQAFQRDFLITYGREMFVLLNQYADKLTEEAKRRAADAGTRALKAAGDSSEEVDLSPLDGMDPLLFEGILAMLCPST
ncbi:hypothetical protein FRB99_005506 [Tulasnella sp. 403]|nr:hypothetical protein FRB99_005506 [Tulasnella sp. 403]